MSQQLSNNSGLAQGLLSGAAIAQSTSSQQGLMGTNATSWSNLYGNSISGTLPPPTGISTYPSYSPFYGIPEQRYDVQIRKVENGFILKMDNKEYIITDNKQVLKFLDLCGKKVNEIK